MNTSNQKLMNLIRRTGEGNHHAFEVLYKRLSPFLNSYVLSILHCEALSNEVLQDSFIQIWQSSARYNPDRGQPLSWICTIVRSRAIDKLRAEKKHQRGASFAQENLEVDKLTSKEQPELDFAKQQQKLNFSRHLAQLPPHEHLAITLAYVHGYSRQELSRTLDTNVNTVKSWLRRGLKHLQDFEDLAA
jgi:RNA polymerase sigma-70 factor (ECF subfamily)